MTEDNLLQQIEALERRLERRLGVALQPIAEGLQRIETKVDKTNGRVTHLEVYRIGREAREDALAAAAKTAAEVVAVKAADALASRDRSSKWKFAMATLALGLIGAVTTLSAFVAPLLH